MSIITKLTWKQIKRNKRRTRITMISIILSLTMIITITHLMLSSKDAYRNLIIDTFGDYHISFNNVSDLQIAELKKESSIESYYVENNLEGVPTIYIRLKNIDKNYKEEASDIADKYSIPLSDGTQSVSEFSPGSLIELSFNKDLLASEGVISNVQLAFAVTFFGSIFILIVAFASILVINNSFQISADERIQQFGVLKSAGGTNKQVQMSVFSEGIILSIISIPIGLVSGLVVQWLVTKIFEALLPEMIKFRFLISPIALGISICITSIIVLISAYLPARKASKTSPIDSIRMTKSIRVNKKQVETSSLVQKLFGIEGMLATKTFKRNRSKNRAAIMSLVVGIILFIGVSSFGQYVSRISQMAYPEYGSDVIITFNQVEYQKLKEIQNQLSKIPNDKLVMVKRYQTQTVKSDIKLSNEAKDNVSKELDINQNSNVVVLFSLDENRYNEISKQLGINNEQSPSQISGILINRLTSRYIDIKPFDIDSGTVLSTDDKSIDREIIIAGSINTIPTEISMLIQRSLVSTLSVIISEKDMQYIENSTPAVSSYFFVNTDNPSEFMLESERILSDEFSLTSENYVQVDFSSFASMNRNIVYLAKLLVYGFISLLTLIAVTSVINTITTNLELRKKEYAMLLSVGMTIKSRNRMVLFENLQYGIKALVIGIPLGLVISYLFYFALQQYFSFKYALPWSSILIGISVVMMIMLLMGRYSIRKLKNINIVETLKSQLV